MNESHKTTNNTIQAAWVALGGLFSMGFGIISAMILSRYLSKEDYGIYKQVIYIYTTLNGLFVLGLPKAYSYFLPRSPLSEAKSLISKITKLFFILGGALSLLLFFCSGIIADILRSPQLEYMLKIFSPVPVLMMPTLGLEGILATYRETKFITVYTVLTRVGMLLCVCMPIMFLDLGVEAALIGFVISSIISFVIALYLKYYPVRHCANLQTTETYKSIFKFCFPLFIASIWGVLINSTDQFFISRYFGDNVFADFSNGAMELPFVGMIIGATSTVLTPLFSKHVHEQSDVAQTILPIWMNTFAKSAMLIYPITFFCMFDAESIMVTMYGENYIASAPFFQIKLITYFFKVIVFYALIIALGGVNFYQRLHMYIFFIMALLEYISVIFIANPLLITAIHVGVTILLYLSMMRYVASKLKVSILSLVPVKLLSKVCGISILSCLFFSSIKLLIYSQLSVFMQLCIDVVLMIFVYLILGTICRLNYWSIIKPLFKRNVR